MILASVLFSVGIIPGVKASKVIVESRYHFSQWLYRDTVTYIIVFGHKTPDVQPNFLRILLYATMSPLRDRQTLPTDKKMWFYTLKGNKIVSSSKMAYNKARLPTIPTQ